MMFEAQRRGMIDFREARLNDPAWWRYYRTIMRGLKLTLKTEGTRARLDYRLSLMSQSGLAPDAFKGVQEQSQEALNDYLDCLEPWKSQNKEQVQQELGERLRASYVEVFGDPNDPEYQRKIEETVAALRKNADTPKETDDQRIDRLSLERHLQQRAGRTP